MFHTYEKKNLKTVTHMALPAIAESFFVALVSLVDSFMVSFLGPNAVASVGLTTQPKFIALAIFIAINVSVAALIARRYGERRRKDANTILVSALGAILVLAIVMSVVFVHFAPQIITLCGSEPETHDGAVAYFRIIVGGMIFNCIPLGINAAQRGAGNTRITMRTNVASNFVNVVFNYLLINGNLGFPAMGIRGAAVATVIGTMVASVMSVVSIMKPEGFISIPYIIKEKIYPKLAALRDIIKLGYSVFVEQLLMRVGFLFTAVMMAKLGSASFAAHQVCMNVLHLSFSFGDGLQAAAIALIGRSLGERDPDKAKEFGRTCQMLGGVISVILAVIFIFGARWLMGTFFREEEIVRIGISMMWILIPVVLFQIRQVIYTGSLRGAGDTRFTAFTAVLSVTVIRTAISYLCAYPLGLGAAGVWMGILADQVSRYIINGIRFRAGKWTKIKI